MPLDDVDADISADPMDDAVLTRAMQDVNQAIAANLSSAAAVADSAGAGDQRSRALDENPIANQAVVAMHQLRRGLLAPCWLKVLVLTNLRVWQCLTPEHECTG